MITSIVFVHVASSQIPEVAEQIAAIEGVSEVYSVTGRIDLIAMIRAHEFDAIAEIVSDKIAKVDGVIDTETHLAFRAYSKHDLDATFALGGAF